MVWLSRECETCFGMGIVLPDENSELDLCPDCRGFGRVASQYRSFGLVESLLLSDGTAQKTRRECLAEIELN